VARALADRLAVEKYALFGVCEHVVDARVWTSPPLRWSERSSDELFNIGAGIRPRLSGRSPTCEGRRRPPTAALTLQPPIRLWRRVRIRRSMHRAPPPMGDPLGAYQAGVYEALSEADFVPFGRADVRPRLKGSSADFGPRLTAHRQHSVALRPTPTPIRSTRSAAQSRRHALGWPSTVWRCG
jgi:hypothetical protein